MKNNINNKTGETTTMDDKDLYMAILKDLRVKLQSLSDKIDRLTDTIYNTDKEFIVPMKTQIEYNTKDVSFIKRQLRFIYGLIFILTMFYLLSLGHNALITLQNIFKTIIARIFI